MPWRSVGVLALLTITALLWWLGTRETAQDKEIKRLLAELRASGEPIDAQDLARLFPNPPPHEDAGKLLTNILVFAVNNRLPASTPVVITSVALPRTVPMPEMAMRDLRAYHERTKAIWDQWPEPWPAGMRFASHWERGMMSNSVPNFVHVRTLAQMLAVMAMTAAEDDDPQRAADMILRGFQFLEAVPSDSLVPHMIKRACAGLGVLAVERCLNHVQFTDSQLRQIEQALPRAVTNQFTNALHGEHVMAIWAFSEVKAGRNADELLYGRQRDEKWWEALWRRLKPGRAAYSDGDFVRYLGLYRSSLDMTTLPPTQAVARAGQLVEAYATNITSELGEAVPAAWQKGLRASFEIEAQLTALRTALALERFRLTHEGKIPVTLAELVPAYLPKIPRDIFDNLPLPFKPLPRGYVLYSIGADGVDDGGLEWSNAATNYDKTFTVER